MTYKILSEDDIVNTRTLLHEAIPLTGTIVSGTYGSDLTPIGSETNIKNYAHGMFQSVYDYPYLSSSANHIFDITVGLSPQGALYGDAVSSGVQASKKKNIYNQMAQVLVGYDATGSVMPFDNDGDILAGGKKITECFIIPFSRLLTKDEIKKETFSMTLGVNATYKHAARVEKQIQILDVSASTEYRVNSPAGEYGILYATASNSMMTASLSGQGASSGGRRACGLIFYQAGVCVLTSSIFHTGALEKPGGFLRNAKGTNIPGIAPTFDAGGRNLRDLIGNTNETGSTITDICDGIRNKFIDLSFNNTTELNSTIYFCRANHNEFNYSANPTYLDNSKIRVKGNDILTPPRSYVTTVGMYSADNELLAVAKLSEPLRKDPTNELTLRVRLDY